MTKLSDAELQALVYQTGITPCDRLPKPDPKVELIGLLHFISDRINGAAKAGDVTVNVSTKGFPIWAEKTLRDAAPILNQLGYTTKIEPIYDGHCLRISGWI